MATETPTTLTIDQVGRQGPRQFQALFDVIPFTFNFEEDSIAAGAGSSGTVTVTGAALGDLVLVAPAQGAEEAMLWGTVTAANTVGIGAFNVDTGAAETGFATVGVGKGVVLKFKDNIFAAAAA